MGIIHILHNSIPVESRPPANNTDMLFCSREFDLNPMTLLYELELNILNIYRSTKNEVYSAMLLKAKSVNRTDRDMQMGPNALMPVTLPRPPFYLTIPLIPRQHIEHFKSELSADCPECRTFGRHQWNMSFATVMSFGHFYNELLST